MKLKIALLVSAVSLLVLLGLAYLPYRQWTESGAGDRVWHHELAADADLTIGTTSVPADGIVDETFASHLPLVIIDTHGEEIVNYKYFDVDTDSFIYQEGVDPYVDISPAGCTGGPFSAALSTFCPRCCLSCSTFRW